jgi:maltose alpha-D-glucosyltransferase / alpha-amylase
VTGLETQVPVIRLSGAWQTVFEASMRPALAASLPRFLGLRRWFAGKARHIDSVEIVDAVPIPETSPAAYFALIKVAYTEGDPDTYVLPLTFEAAAEVPEELAAAVVARLVCHGEEGLLYETLAEEGLTGALLEAIANSRQFKGAAGSILAAPTRAFKKLRGSRQAPLKSSVMKVEQSNTSIVYGDKLIMKVFRRLQEGINPDVEIGTFLTERTSFRHFPPVAGTLAYQRGHNQPMSMGILQAFVPNQGDAWRYSLDSLREYLERAAADGPGLQARVDSSVQGNAPGLRCNSVRALISQELPSLAQELLGTYLDAARLLGQRTAEMHIALASDSLDPSFAPEPFSEDYQRSLHDGMRGLAGKIFRLLRHRLNAIPEAAREEAQEVLGLEQEVLGRFRSVLEHAITAVRTRTHGDFHLGQVLRTGDDFVIIDFEGEPGRPISERRIKLSPLRDAAGMVRSFHYAAYSSLMGRLPDGGTEYFRELEGIESWAQRWYRWASSAFLKSYLQVAAHTPFVPQSREELEVLLQAYLLEKAIYELGYELNNRPDWVKIPLRGILQLLEPAS